MIKKIFDLVRLFLRKRQLAVKNSDRYFFIIGSGRCGSTLLRVILERNDQVVIVPEISTALPKACELHLNSTGKTSNSLFEDFYNLYTKQKSWDSMNLSREQIVDRFNFRTSTPYSEFLVSLYLAYQYQKKPDAKLIGDKNPYLTFYLPVVVTTFPKAKFIHLVRDGRDVAFSWSRNETLGVNLIDAAKRWNMALRQVERFKFLMRNRFLEIKYEDLILNSESTLRRICEFLKIPYSHTMLDERINNSSQEVGQGHHKHAVKKPDPSLMGQWRMLSEDELALIYPVISERLRKYEYLRN